uniref:Uncharacterized protein n=1 Tax=viral metagenome TaxID=1070528 RepID=A0A6H1ZYL9_9ZZZZ
MTRTLEAAMNTAIAAASGYADVWLLSLTSSGGTTLITTAPQNVKWGADTYTAVGGAISFEPPQETSDSAAQALRMTLSGVTQTIIADLLTNHMRGYSCTLYFGQIDPATGAVVVDPMEVFTGLLNDRWEIQESRDELTRGTVTITTSAVSQLARYLFPRGVRSNVASHNDMLDRASLAVGDTFFSRVPTLVGKTVLWGKSITPVGDTVLGGIPNTGEGDTFIE